MTIPNVAKMMEKTGRLSELGSTHKLFSSAMPCWDPVQPKVKHESWTVSAKNSRLSFHISRFRCKPWKLGARSSLSVSSRSLYGER